MAHEVPDLPSVGAAPEARDSDPAVVHATVPITERRGGTVVVAVFQQLTVPAAYSTRDIGIAASPQTADLSPARRDPSTGLQGTPAPHHYWQRFGLQKALGTLLCNQTLVERVRLLEPCVRRLSFGLHRPRISLSARRSPAERRGTIASGITFSSRRSYPIAGRSDGRVSRRRRGWTRAGL